MTLMQISLPSLVLGEQRGFYRTLSLTMTSVTPAS